jgi:hypothetical protein
MVRTAESYERFQRCCLMNTFSKQEQQCCIYSTFTSPPSTFHFVHDELGERSHQVARRRHGALLFDNEQSSAAAYTNETSNVFLMASVHNYIFRAPRAVSQTEGGIKDYLPWRGKAANSILLQ